MLFYLSIDDTDNLSSPGSGQLANDLAKNLEKLNLAGQCSSISRHQLYVNEAVPYTSHNSSMCFTAETNNGMLDQVIRYSQSFLEENCAPGSDPGLCVAINNDTLDRDPLITFGLKAKNSLLTKEDATNLAEKTGVHLSEHGGTGDGIIGALAGIGLRIMGNDGRVRGWLSLEEASKTIPVQKLLAHSMVDGIIDNTNQLLPADTLILVSDFRLKTVLHNHLRVIPVTENKTANSPDWRTLTHSEIKNF